MSSAILFAEHLPGILMAGGAAILAMLMLLNLRSRLARRRQAESPREFIERVREEAGEPAAPVEIKGSHATSLHLEETAKRLIAQIDGRASRLEELIRRADERLRRLEEAEAPAPVASISPMKLNGRDREDAEESGGYQIRHPAEAGARRPWREPPDPLAASVYELADRGRTPVEIAQTLDEQVGKVELILALRACTA